MRSPDFIPRTEEQIEEDKRLYKNDKERGNYVPVDEIPDRDMDIEDELADSIDNKLEAPEFEETDAKKIDRIRKELSEEKIGFLRGQEGVAHVGPDFYEESKKVEDREKAETPLVEKNENLPLIISKSRFLNKISSILAYSRNYRKNFRKPAEGKDNRKTMSSSKKERGSRKEIGDIIKGDNRYEEHDDSGVYRVLD